VGFGPNQHWLPGQVWGDHVLCATTKRGTCTTLYRRIVLWVEDKQEEMVFFTNHLHWGASTVTAVYKDRWQIESFFKSLKQLLRVKIFVGTSPKCVKDANLDSTDRDAAVEVPAAPLHLRLVSVQSVRAAAPATLRLPRSIPLAQRSLSTAPRSGGLA
jgi:hypothetical protein